MFSNKYIITFTLVMTFVVATVLSLMSSGLKGIHEENASIFNKRSILSAVGDHLGKDLSSMSKEEVLNIFETKMDDVVLDSKGNVVEGIKAIDVDMEQEAKKKESDRKYPLFVYHADGKDFYILSVRGNGLWDKIWGCVALEADMNTVAGVAFDHKGETPGLGAEIKDNALFKKQFVGTQIMDNGKYVSVMVRKGGAKDKKHEVDAISGATITSNGVTEMLNKGIAYYLPYLEKNKKQ